MIVPFYISTSRVEELLHIVTNIWHGQALILDILTCV